MPVQRDILEKESILKPVLSSKKGGQHVNKVATQAQVFFHIQNSMMFSDEEKERLIEKLGEKISGEGYVIVSSQESRSLIDNSAKAFDKLEELLKKALFRPKRRKKTTVPRSVKARRVDQKKKRSKIKENRRGPKGLE